jgi:hypothetical protein
VWFADAPIYTIWSRNRAHSDATIETNIDWKAEGALLTRPHDTVEWTLLDAAGCAFLDTCAASSTLATAAGAALDKQTNADLAQLMSTLLAAGAFGGMTLADHSISKKENTHD